MIRIEVLGHPDQTGDQTRRALSLLDLFGELPLREPVVQAASQLRRRQTIRPGDAIIAATALEHDLSLVTRNTDDFQWIEGLTLVNPFEE